MLGTKMEAEAVLLTLPTPEGKRPAFGHSETKTNKPKTLSRIIKILWEQAAVCVVKNKQKVFLARTPNPK